MVDELKYGGDDAEEWSFFLNIPREAFMTGNLDLLGGLSPQEETGEDEPKQQ